MSGWLSPYRVIDLTDARGLLAGQMLGKLGADVIQVEPPGGSPARRVAPIDADGRSLYWSAFAAWKRGITLDIAAARGRELLHSLLGTADVLIDSADPGCLERLGLGREAIAARHPRLVHVSVTAFGSEGPKQDWAASDITLWAAGGPLFPHRDHEGPPLRISAPQAWLHGAADAASGATMALFARLRTGRGQHVDISVQEAVTPTTLSSITAAAVGHDGFNLFPPPARSPPGPDGRPQPRGPKWPVKDGLVELGIGGGPGGPRTNLLFAWMKEEGALPDRFADWDWTAIMPRIASGEITQADLDAAREAIAAFLSPRTKAELEREAVARRLLLAPVNTVADLLESDQLASRGYFVEVEEAGARRILPGAFAKGPKDMFAPPRGAPAIGEHNEAVFGDLLGLSAGEIAALRAEGVI